MRVNLTFMPYIGSLTVLTNVYNEEYLLPFWLEHHKHIFDHGIIIDYGSTDSSMDIVRRICPTWTIMKTRNEFYDSKSIDDEFMDLEQTISGYKIVLNTTEFIVGPIRRMIKSYGNNCYSLQCLAPVGQDFSNPTTLAEVFKFERIEEHSRMTRLLHSYPHGNYTRGRHEISHPLTGTINVYIVWFGMYPWNNYVIKRKLQIKNKMSESDKNQGYGIQHLWTEQEMEDQRRKLFNKSVPISSYPILREYINRNVI